MNILKLLLLPSLFCLSLISNAQLRDRLDIRVGVMYDTPLRFETWEWYGDEVDAPFPTTYGGLTFGVGSRFNKVVYWSADFQVSFGENRGAGPNRSCFSFGLPVTVGLILPVEKKVKWKLGLFGGPQRFVHDGAPEYPYHTVLYYGATSGIAIPIAENSLNLDVFYAPKLKVSQNPSGYWRKPTATFEHLRVSLTYQWNQRSE